MNALILKNAEALIKLMDQQSMVTWMTPEYIAFKEAILILPKQEEEEHSLKLYAEETFSDIAKNILRNDPTNHSDPSEMMKDYMIKSMRYLSELYENRYKTGNSPYSNYTISKKK